MKLNIIILFFLFLTNCSKNNDLSRIKSSFGKLIVTKKQVDSKDTRIPVGNIKYLDQQKINDIKQSSSSSNSELSLKKNDNYPKLIEIPKNDYNHDKILADKDLEIQQLQNDLEKIKREKEEIESNQIKDTKSEQDFKKLQQDLDDAQKKIKLTEEQKSVNAKTDDSQAHNDSKSQNQKYQNSPKIIDNLDESGMYRKKNIRQNLLPKSRYN